MHTRVDVEVRELTPPISLYDFLAQITRELGTASPDTDYIYLDIALTDKDLIDDYDEYLSKESFYDICILSEDFDITALIKEKESGSWEKLFITGLSVAAMRDSAALYDVTALYEDYVDINATVADIQITEDKQ